MAVRPIRIVGDPVLRTPTEPVTDFGDELAELVTDLFDTMKEAPGVGLAANQIGVPLQVFVYDCPDEVAGMRVRGVLVNPSIETSTIPETMPDPDADWEGCLSLPGEQFPTGRADWARVTGVDEHGEPVVVEAHGFLGRCLQHETDHLQGRLYVDRLVGRHAREARRALRRNGWGGPGLSWQPGDSTDPEHLRRLDR